MDFEYNDDADDGDIRYFAELIRDYPISDDDIRGIFSLLLTAEDPVVLHDMFAFEFRAQDIAESRVTRICKSMSNHIFRIQFLNGQKFIIRLNSHQSYEHEISIINAVAGVGVEVPRCYFSHVEGIEIGRHRYFAMMQEHIDGIDFEEAVHRGLVGTGYKEVLLSAMGERLKKIHSITELNGSVQENMHENFYGEALDLLDHEREHILREEICSQEDFESMYVKLDTLRDSARLLGTSSFGLVHFDFHPKHVMLDVAGSRPEIKAILDWGDSLFSNIYFDFALWDFWCGDDFLIDSLMESYGMEAFTSSESKFNVELTTIASLIKEVCAYAHIPSMKATQLGLWQRLMREVTEATY